MCTYEVGEFGERWFALINAQVLLEGIVGVAGDFFTVRENHMQTSAARKVCVKIKFGTLTSGCRP